MESADVAVAIDCWPQITPLFTFNIPAPPMEMPEPAAALTRNESELMTVLELMVLARAVPELLLNSTLSVWAWPSTMDEVYSVALSSSLIPCDVSQVTSPDPFPAVAMSP
jgi:hypothetical protein